MPNQSIVVPNKMKQALRDGQPQIGTMISEIRQAAVVQLLANAGFDFVIIDNEHGPFNIETIADLSRTARYVGLTPIVRVPELGYRYLAQSLDAGAQGVMIPRVTDVAQVHEAVQMMKYPPLGRRGNAIVRGHTNFRSGPMAEMLTQSNEATMLVIQIETQQAVEQIEEIAAVPGVDVALIGPADLSISLDVPGQMEAPELQVAIEATIKACQKHGTAPAIHMNDVKLATYWAKMGMQAISSSSDAGLMMKAGLELTTVLGEAMGRGEIINY
ncbi:MAG: aldolase/citrate lyase family protein [Anaerolineae bacterium]|nr:aldolase/citrate lyase family protein [Anaerolineae bacterium]